MNAPSPHKSLADHWPAQDLQFLGACPCCGSQARRSEIEGLRDFLTGAAPGEWRMWRCGGCNCAYLDPRPTPESIERAYAGYYTRKDRVGLARRVAQRLKFAYRIATRDPDPDFNWVIRHLNVAKRRGERLLDVGFGSGAFLQYARWLNYEPVGIDFDPEVVKAGQAQGFDVRQGGLPGSGLPEASFAHITMSNVLEHLPEPIAALEEVFRLLKPKGRLWLNQPNLAALGIEEFGIYWRGWEAPRHLTLWEASDLCALLGRLGFVDVRLIDMGRGPHTYTYRASQLQRMGHLPEQAPPQAVAEAAAFAELKRPDKPVPPEVAENLTIVAYRPG